MAEDKTSQPSNTADSALVSTNILTSTKEYTFSGTLSTTVKNINDSKTVTGSLYKIGTTDKVSDWKFLFNDTKPMANIAETKRLKIDTLGYPVSGTTWTSTDALGNNDLQLFGGAIQYPNKNYSGINDNKNDSRDYTTTTLTSNLSTTNGTNFAAGEKVYCFKIGFARVAPEPTLTITGSGLVDSGKLDSNLTKICVITANTDDITKIIKRNALITTGNGGINNSYIQMGATTIKIALSYLGEGETIDTNGAFVLIAMKGTGATITNITLE